MVAGHTSAKSLTLLFSCVGRRVELVQSFRAAAAQLGIQLRVIGTDTVPIAPALACVDEAVVTPRVTDPAYVPLIVDLVKLHGVRAIIPTIDPDLPVLSRHHATFDALGCTAMLSSPSVIQICRDKMETFYFLRDSGIDTPMTYLPDEIRELTPKRYPYFVKPRYGSASVNTHKLDEQFDLDYYLRKHGGRDPIVQEFLTGQEYTLDVYVGLTGEPRCVVPRARWSTRGGEVSQGVVIKDRDVMEAGKRVVEKLGTSCRGLVTLQCMVTPERRIRFIEINARFGGGAPLGIAAGANYPLWLLQELMGITPQIAFDGFEHGMCVSRYDWSVFVPLGPEAKPALVRTTRPFPQY
ncbi:MAG: ATP-grasp domain-containing protein [Phycisphaerae bacterium]